ncbi:MAG TPA: enolase C-terminal domain-like protein [Sphingomicrobium sp.]|nr:enolase C-terminal domain-like protein [Sphingomicrobium sp.]
MSRIVRVEVGRFDYPLVGDFKFFRSPARATVLMRLTDEDGVQGWGQSVPIETWTYETAESVESTLRQYLAPAILGADPSNIAEIHARMERAIRPSFSIGQPLCKAAVDLACYDLWGKQTGRAVSELLGGRRIETIPLSWTINAPSIAAAERQLEQGRALGYDSFNIKVGYPQTTAYDLALVRAVTAFAPNGFHWCDANTSYDVDISLEMAPQLADFGLKALESPLPPNRIRDYQRLKKQGALPILMDEGIVSPVEVSEFIALDMFDGIAMKVARCGGLWNASRIAKLLQENGLLLFASGLTDPDLSMAASAHFFASAGLAFPAALNGPQFIAGRGTTDPRFRPVANELPVPDGPGLGLTLGADVQRSVGNAAAREALPA